MMKDKCLRRFSNWSQAIIGLLPLALALPAQAVSLPTQPGIVHFDLNPGMERDILPAVGLPDAPSPVVGGPCNLFEAGFRCQFTDSLNSLANWRAELIIANPIGGFPMIADYPLDLVFPGGSFQGKLNLGFGQEAHFIFEAKDGAVGKETGPWNFVMQNVSIAANLPPLSIAIDAAITEVFDPPIGPPPSPLPPNNFVGFFDTQTGEPSTDPLNSIDFTSPVPDGVRIELIQSVPEPSSVVGLGILSLGLLLNKNRRC